jgi:uncharacterized membrane protein
VWAALILPWALAGQLAALWLLWLLLVNLGVVLYFHVHWDALGLLSGNSTQLLALVIIDTAALVIWEWSAPRYTWLQQRWGTRVLAFAGGSAVSVLLVREIFETSELGMLALVLYCAWWGAAYVVYRHKIPDLFVLAGLCLSVIVSITAFLIRHMTHHAEAGTLLFIGMLVIALSSAAAVWLRSIAGSQR